MLATLALVTSCAGITGGGGPLPAQSAQPQGTGAGYIANTIAVSGYGEASGAPDIATITLGVSVTDPDVGEAVTRSNEVMQAVQDALTEAGIAAADMQTVGFSVWPEDRYDPQTGQPTGERVYHVDNQLSIKVRDLGQTGSVIEVGLDAGANTVYGLSFGVEDTSALEAEARTKAVEDARGRAQELAEALGVTLGDPISVMEGYGAYPPVVYGAAADGLGGGGGAPPISPGQLTTSMNVTVVYSITR